MSEELMSTKEVAAFGIIKMGQGNIGQSFIERF